MLCGFTLQNGTWGHGETGFTKGGAIYCSGAAPTICHNRFVCNKARWGGAISVHSTDGFLDEGLMLVVSKNEFVGNTAEFGNGGAVSLSQTSAIFERNTFIKNAATFDGGAVDDRSYGESVYQRNVFTENLAGDKGGGLCAKSTFGIGSLSVLNNLFTGNSANGSSGAANAAGGAIRISFKTGLVKNNTIVGKHSVSNNFSDGGGVSFGYDVPDLSVESNILAYHQGPGLTCYNLAPGSGLTLGPNLLWQNKDQSGGGCQPDLVGIVAKDPEFCDWKNRDFSVASTSPAISNGQVFGSFPDPGCGIAVQTQQTTWGRVKVMFSSEN